MASKKDNQALLNALKFTPRDIEITLQGYGGEIAMGRISEEAYDFWEGRDDLADYATAWDEGEWDETVPPEARFVSEGSWYDVDDLCHESGCEADGACTITVDDLREGRTIWENSLDLDSLAAKGVDTQPHDHVRPNETEPDGTCVFFGQNFEKGCFFSAQVRITQPFDPSLLRVHWMDCDGWRLITGVEYDSEELDGSGAYSTTGKSMEFSVYRVERDDWDPKAELDQIFEDFPLIEGEEMWAQEAIDSEPEVWNGIQLTKWWPGDFEPYHRGEYEIFEVGSSWPFPQRATWTGRSWKIKKEEVSVRIWRGLTQPAD